MSAGKEIIVLKKVDVKKIMQDIIEKVKGVDLEVLEIKIEEEGNKVVWSFVIFKLQMNANKRRFVSLELNTIHNSFYFNS